MKSELLETHDDINYNLNTFNFKNYEYQYDRN